ncbi:MAG TPA: BMP family ABC transporter substrate-binding protein [Casimicrobiaceae bacterium]|jgi:basic membrane protein A and related proteins|nr:BMP family ABC transporter substrate-binding protein [Casimicrobiaceae bacterium]
MPSFTRRTTLKALGATAAAWALPAGAQNAGPLKIGYIYVSPIGDAGWTHQHDIARIAMEKALAGKVTTKYVENVPEGADAERVIRELAQSGHKLIFTTSFGYMNPTLKVAQQFPNTFFEHATGYKDAKNMGRYNARFYEGRYLAGIVAGRMTRSNVAGYVAAFPIPEVVMGINAFTRGMRSVNPKAETKVVWVSSWFDPGRESEAANTLISQGADVLTHHTDSTAVVQTAEAKKVYSVAYHSDMSKYGPNSELTATTHVWDKYYISRAQAVLDGTWKPDNVWGGIKDGMIAMGPFGKMVPKETQDAMKKAEADIASGKLHPFTGPMKDNDGKERLGAGKVITDDALSKMDYYVEGVQGKLPAK